MTRSNRGGFALPSALLTVLLISIPQPSCQSGFAREWEAESGALTAPMARSPWGFIGVPEGSGDNTTNINRGSATYSITVPAEANYYLWGRAMAPTATDDSFLVQVDGGAILNWYLAVGQDLTWRRVTSSGNPLVVHLRTGKHTLKVAGREDGAILDKLFLTDNGTRTPSIHETKVGTAWSGTRVGFDLLTDGNVQVLAYYAANRHMTLAARKLGTNTWKVKELPTVWDGWDSHNAITMVTDSTGQLHVTGNFHVDPLAGRYFRTTRPGDISTLRAVPMVGTQEDRMTYPLFLKDATGKLFFMYRHGSSGDGDQYINAYDTATQTWKRVLMLFEGQSGSPAMSAYPQMKQDPVGKWHMPWVWRIAPSGAERNAYLSYATSADLRTWKTAAGGALSLPLRYSGATDPKLIDNVPVGGGLLNSMVRVGFDASNRAIVSYHKYVTVAGKKTSQIFNARFEGGAWKRVQATAWTCVMEFSGGGSLPTPANAVGFGEIVKNRDGKLTQLLYACDKTGGTYEINPTTLKPVGLYHGSGTGLVGVPSEYTASEPVVTSICGYKDVATNSVRGRGTNPAANRFFLRWSSLGANRDLARSGCSSPAPQELRLVEVE